MAVAGCLDAGHDPRLVGGLVAPVDGVAGRGAAGVAAQPAVAPGALGTGDRRITRPWPGGVMRG